MHIRSRISEADLQRARERRAWGSLFICIGLGAAMAAAGLSTRRAIARHFGAHNTAPTALLAESEAPAESPTVPPPTRFPEVEPPVPRMDFPSLQVPATVYIPEAPECPVADWLDCAVVETETADFLPVPEFTIPTHAPLAVQTKDTGAGEAQAPVTPPAYKETPTPPYPPALRASRIEGSVRVRIAVDAAGRPMRVDILTGSGHREFDTCAHDWILAHWLFTPARRGGTPIAGSVTTSVHFVLH